MLFLSCSERRDETGESSARRVFSVRRWFPGGGEVEAVNLEATTAEGYDLLTARVVQAGCPLVLRVACTIEYARMIPALKATGNIV